MTRTSNTFDSTSLKLAAAYSRFSSDKQDEKSNHDQLHECRKKIGDMGFTNPDELVFSDEAISGQCHDRPGLNKLLESARNQQFKLLVVFSLSRLARDQLLTLQTLRELTGRHGIRVISISESLDSLLPTWELVVPLLSIFHEQYVKDLGKNAYRGLVGNFRDGFSNGDYCFGYTSTSCPNGSTRIKNGMVVPRKVVVIDPEQSSHVKQIFQWYLRDAYSINRIVKQLNQMKVKKSHRARTPTWYHALISKMLQNPKYIGIWIWGKLKNVRDTLNGKVKQVDREEDDDQIETQLRPDLLIIEPERFLQVQEKIAHNKAVHCKGRKSGRFAHPEFRLYPQYLLSHRMQCAQCGANMIITGSSRRYFCCKNKLRGTCDCKTTVAFSLVTQMVLSQLLKDVIEKDKFVEMIFQAGLNYLQRYQELNGDGKKLDRLFKEKEVIEQKIKRLVDSIEDGKEDDVSDVRKRLRNRKDELKKLEREISIQQSQTEKEIPEMTRDWVMDRMRETHVLLSEDNTKASLLLETLLDGPIILQEIKQPNQRKNYFRASMKVHPFQMLQDTLPCLDDDNTHISSIEPVLLEFDLLAPNPTHDQIRKFKELFDQGLLMKEIAVKLKVSVSRITAVKKQASKFYQMEFDIGRQRQEIRKKALQIPLMHEKLAERVHELKTQGFMNQDIATMLGTNRDMITKCIRYWNKQHGLPDLDGRSKEAIQFRRDPAA
jgi:DNA invertase Pin-like site-specific DNA recombinase/uncharacterized protein YdcH (DUF465 family)